MNRYNAQGARNLALHYELDALMLQLLDPNNGRNPQRWLYLRRQQMEMTGRWRRLEALCRLGYSQPAVTPPHEMKESQ